MVATLVRSGKLVDRGIDPEPMRRIADNLWRETRLFHGERLRELREELTQEQLIEKYDALVEEAARATGGPHQAKEKAIQLLERAQVYADELARREAVRQGERMEALTRSINRLTVFIAIATFVGVGLAVWTLLSGG